MEQPIVDTAQAGQCRQVQEGASECSQSCQQTPTLGSVDVTVLTKVRGVRDSFVTLMFMTRQVIDRDRLA